jgi:hypothetical protein
MGPLPLGRNLLLFNFGFLIFYQGSVLTHSLLVMQASSAPAHNNVTVV